MRIEASGDAASARAPPTSLKLPLRYSLHTTVAGFCAMRSLAALIMGIAASRWLKD